VSTEKINLDIHRILTLLPHRYPILLVDRVLELEPHKRIKALKNVSINEPYFMGHFPSRPVMPGVSSASTTPRPRWSAGSGRRSWAISSAAVSVRRAAG